MTDLEAENTRLTRDLALMACNYDMAVSAVEENRDLTREVAEMRDELDRATSILYALSGAKSKQESHDVWSLLENYLSEVDGRYV